MAKQTGLGDYIAIDDSGGTARDISSDVSSLSIGNTQNLLEVTALDKSAVERLVALSDGTASISGTCNFSANKEHAVLAEGRGSTRTFDYRIGGNTSSNPRLQMEMVIGAYTIDRGNDGSQTWSCELSLQSGTVPDWDTVP
tara:strand:+ start:2446 stop:2868 length:423 start_codon:yes stop_codon:yes gene_type:complete